ncbi:XYPPX repeat family protein [Tritrichomonas foetus]|uniref:Choline transporter-like protein n=1 Tax=Tritrichomonas foetus TaxID=1144522 RepID=A0A1J4JQW6_9EUKA|nr:XYPPX repeat family protein [Tritrichomonas foetus]|eukprot:OHS99909.1 XYPPX repeat family protein [Tritrichomonas foetus]
MYPQQPYPPQGYPQGQYIQYPPYQEQNGVNQQNQYYQQPQQQINYMPVPNQTYNPPVYNPNAPENDPNLVYGNNQNYPVDQNQYANIPVSTAVAYDNNQEKGKEEGKEKKKRWKYDPRNLQIQSITIDQWESIEADETKYSKHWENVSSFEPETFAQNTKEQKTCNDMCWAICFWINFLIFVLVFAIMAFKAIKKWNKYLGIYEDVTTPDELFLLDLNFNNTEISAINLQGLIDDNETKLTAKVVYYALGFGVLIAFVLNLVHLIYVSCFPSAYIKSGFFIVIVIAVVLCIPAFLEGIWAVVAFPIILALISLITYCCIRKYIPLSACMLKQSMRIIWKTPSIYLIIIFELLLELIISLVFCLSLIFTIIAGWSYGIYVYLLFSYYWITMTFGYVTFLTISGAAAEWYFLNGTELMPTCGACSSFKRACTSSFGSAALAGMIMSILNALSEMIKKSVKSAGGCWQIFCCCVYCLIKIIECCFSMIARFGLVYCATFGVPFFEGCRRWAELETKKFVGTILNDIIISKALSIHGIVFYFGSAMLGLGLAFMLMANNTWLKIFLPVSSFACTFCLFTVMKMPISTLTDTIFVCFSECPNNLKTTAYELYEMLAQAYDKAITLSIQFKNN